MAMGVLLRNSRHSASARSRILHLILRGIPAATLLPTATSSPVPHVLERLMSGAVEDGRYSNFSVSKITDFRFEDAFLAAAMKEERRRGVYATDRGLASSRAVAMHETPGSGSDPSWWE